MRRRMIGAATDCNQKRRAPCGALQRFSEPAALSSTSTNRPSASGLPPLRRTARSWFRPNRAPCSLQEGTYAGAPRRARLAQEKFSQIAELFLGGHKDRVLAAVERPPV